MVNLETVWTVYGDTFNAISLLAYYIYVISNLANTDMFYKV